MTLLLAEVETAQMTGQWIGSVLGILLLSAGLIKCLTLLRRPATSKTCVSALALALAGWLGALLFQSIAFLVPEALAVVYVIGGLGMAGLMLAAIVTGITGLALYDSKVHTQGRAQAVWSLVIAVLMLTVAVTGLVLQMRLESAANKLASLSGKGAEIRSAEFNCSLEIPPRWLETKPALINKLACIAARRAAPEAYVMVLGEHIDGEMDLEALLDAVKANMAATSKSVTGETEESLTVDGVPFMRRACLVENDAAKGIKLYFEQWVSTLPGYAWQLHMWGPVAGRADLEPQFKRIGESFRVLDKQRVVPASAALDNVSRPQWGYRTEFNAGDWKKWGVEGHEQTLADFAALRPLEAFIVLPVNLGPEPPPLEAAASGLLDRFGIPFPSDDWPARKWPNAWGEGIEITGVRSLEDGDYSYRMRVAARGPVALLIAGWHAVKNGDPEMVRKAVDGVVLLPGEPGEIPGLEESQRSQYGLVCNDIGIWHHQRQQTGKAAEWFWRGFQQTQKDPTILGNALDAWQQTGRAAEALEKAGEHIKKFPAHVNTQLSHARLLCDLGHDDEAADAFAAALKAGVKDPDAVLRWLQYLNGAEKYALAEKTAAAWMEQSGNLDSRRWHAQTVASNGGKARAIQLFEKMVEEHPEDRRLLYELAETRNDAAEYLQAAELAQGILKDTPDSARAWMILGWSQMGRKWYREAKESFEKALEKQPDSEDIQQALRRASAMLGQGSNSDIKTPIEPVALPEELREMLEKNPPAAGHAAGQPVAWLLSATGYHFEKDKPLRTTWHVRVKLRDSEGVSRFSSVEHNFDPLGSRVFINSVEVRDEEGRVIASAAGDAYVMDVDNGMGTHDKKLHFQIPGLRPGCVVEYVISQESRYKAETFEFNRHLFSDSAADIVFVTGDVDGVAFAGNASLADLKHLRQDRLLAWTGLHLPQSTREPFPVLMEERVPCLALGGHEGSWAEVGDKLLDKELAGRLEPEAEVTALAQRLIQGVGSEGEKIAALARHVQQAISYTAIEFGTRARRPNPAAQTLGQKYGDCKDQALLLHQLLTAAGIGSHLALVSNNWRTRVELPSVDQFNHMVVHVPALGPGFLIDTTNKNLALASLHADNLWHSHALVLERGKSRLIEPAQPAPGSARILSERKVRPSGDGWEVNESLVIHGYYAAWMRGAFTGKDAQRQLQNVQNILAAHAPALRVHEFSFHHLEDTGLPARLEIAYEVPGRLQDEGALRRGALPALWEQEYLGTTFVKNRASAFRFIYPLQFESDLRVEGADGIPEDTLKTLNVSREGRFASWKMEAAAQGGGLLKLRFRFSTQPGTYDAADYPDWHEQWNSAVRQWQRPFSWKP
ncbi:MAG TPA: hypothetical protein DIT64_05660 [Verrucomicrobiales bacterium]|nr:hypothetical protein [Verrucomicrobiales bacterium]